MDVFILKLQKLNNKVILSFQTFGETALRGNKYSIIKKNNSSDLPVVFYYNSGISPDNIYY